MIGMGIAFLIGVIRANPRLINLELPAQTRVLLTQERPSQLRWAVKES